MLTRKLMVSVFLVACVTSAAAPATADGPKSARPPDQYGRYVITFSPFARADTYLLDTQTGKVWQLIKYTDVVDEPNVWQFIQRIDSDAQFGEWLKTQRIKQRSAP